MTRARAILTLILLAACLALPGAAHAAGRAVPAIPTGTDCLRPPTAESPSGVFPAWIDPGPKTPVAGDPFDPNSPASLYDVYGYAGFGTGMFDPGCLSVAKVWDAPNEIANLLATGTAVVIAVAVRGTRLVTEGALGSLWDPLQAQAQAILGGSLFLPLLFVGAIITGVVIMSRQRHGDVAGEASASGRAALILLAGVICATYSLTVGAVIDRGLGESFRAANEIATQSVDGGSREPADAVAANLVGTILYNGWAAATFGTDTPAAEEFGPALFRAGALTREEQAAIDADPTTATSVLDAKRDEYKRVAKQVEDKYPQAYANLAGHSTGQRAGHALAGLLAALAGVGYLIYCLFKMVFAMVAARIGIGAVPAIALIAMVPRWQQVALDLLGWIVEAVVKACAFGFVYAVFLAGGIGGIMSPAVDWHPLVKAGALVIAAVAVQNLLKRLGLSGRSWSFGGQHAPLRRPQAGDALAAAGGGEDGGDAPERSRRSRRARPDYVGFGHGPGGTYAGATRRALPAGAASARPVVWATPTVGQPMITGAARTAATTAAARTAGAGVARAALTTGGTGGLAAPVAITAAAASTVRAASKASTVARATAGARAASVAMTTRRVDPRSTVATITTLPRSRRSVTPYGRLPVRRATPALPPPPPPPKDHTT